MIFKRLPPITLSVLATTAAFADHPTVTIGSGSGATITTASASPLGAGQKVLSLEMQAIDFDPISDVALLEESLGHRDAHSTDQLYQLAVSGAFGITNNFTAGFSVPYLKRENLREGSHHGHVGTEELGDAGGAGDMRLYGQYRFWQGNTAEMAIIGGIKAPTGSTDEESDEGKKLEVELQPGSGSWDSFYGLAWSRRWNQWSLHGNLLYTVVTVGDRDTDLGDIGNYNLATSYRYSLDSPGDHTHHDHHHSRAYLDFILELNGEWRDQVTIDDETEINSGGNILYLSPGIRLGLWRHAVITFSAGMPIIKNLRGEQSEPEVRAQASLSRSF